MTDGHLRTLVRILTWTELSPGHNFKQKTRAVWNLVIGHEVCGQIQEGNDSQRREKRIYPENR